MSIVTRLSRDVCYGLLLMLSLGGVAADADAQMRHASGQNVQAVFEGWQRNADGTFDLVFGYLNRNYVEVLDIPIGPDNFFTPGPADRGQPTHFYPRRQSFLFRVRVPADWGEQDLVWTLIHNGRTATAIGRVSLTWELDEGVWKANRNIGSARAIIGRTSMALDPNQPPTVSVVGDPTVTITVPEAATLAVTVSDDGMPGPQPPSRPRRDGGEVSTTGLPTLTSPTRQDMVKARAAYETGLAVSWLQYRGAGAVTFDPRVVPIDGGGKAVTSVRFGAPGTYTIRAVADDGIWTAPADITVVVKDGATPRARSRP
jgi:hypothetical protein